MPVWVADVKTIAAPTLGTPAAMRAAAYAAGLADIVAEQRPVDVGVTEAEQLVSYRLGHVQFGSWLDQIGSRLAADIARRAADAIRPAMRPYHPRVVFLAAIKPA
jgi:hypothetical protein